MKRHRKTPSTETAIASKTSGRRSDKSKVQKEQAQPTPATDTLPTKSIAAGITSFVLLVCAVWTIFIHFDKSGGEPFIEDACPPSEVESFASSYALGINVIGKILCRFDVIFQTALKDPIKDFTNIFFWGGPAVVFVLLLESSRTDAPQAASYPLIFGLLTQTLSGAIAGALFWGLFLVEACYPGNRQAKKPVSRRDVEAASLAVLFGYGIPTICMLSMKTSLAIALWHPFPVYMSIIQNAWIHYRGKDKTHALGFELAQSVLLAISILGTLSYYYNLWPHLSFFAFSDFWHWIPSLTTPDPRRTTYQSVVLHFLQYDALWTFGTTIVAAFFLLEVHEDYHVEKVEDIAYIISIVPILVLLFGPATVIGGLWINRELCLSERSVKAVSTKRKKKVH